MKTVITTYNGEILPPEIYGGKAHRLSWLITHGYTVPKSIFISCSNVSSAKSNISNQSFIDTLNGYIDSENKYAVRSSGIHEDGDTNSKAGNYKTFLNVMGIADILEKYFAVVSSVKDSHENMGVVIQPMINAKISGVVFSSNPDTGSKTDIVLSYQYGLGEELVSGHSKGNDLRFIVDDSDNISCTSSFSLEYSQYIEIAKISKRIEFPC